MTTRRATAQAEAEFTVKRLRSELLAEYRAYLRALFPAALYSSGVDILLAKHAELDAACARLAECHAKPAKGEK